MRFFERLSLRLESEVRNPKLVMLATFIVLLALALGITAIVLASGKCKTDNFVGRIPESKFQPVATDPYLVGAKQNPAKEPLQLKTSSQPLAFEHQLLSSGCLPHVGCLYPMPNPINIKTGRRDDEIPQGTEVRTCSKAWRDCPAFADCVDGECKPQRDVYKGF